MGTAPTGQTTLRGRRVLVVEDEYMIAQEIVEVLSDVGAETLGPASSVSNALGLVAAENRIDSALLDVNVGRQAVWPVVDMLLARGVPLVLTTGYDASTIPQAYAHLPRCEKPTSGRDLTRMLATIMAKAGAD